MQNSHENTGAEVSFFINLHAWDLFNQFNKIKKNKYNLFQEII